MMRLQAVSGASGETGYTGLTSSQHALSKMQATAPAGVGHDNNGCF